MIHAGGTFLDFKVDVVDFTKNFRYLKWMVSTKKTLCFLAILEVGKFPYPLAVSIQPIWVVHTSILGT